MFMLVSKTFKTDPTDGLLTTSFPAQKVPSGFFHINIFNFGWKPHPGVSFSKANQWLQLTRISSYCTTTATNLTHLCQKKKPNKKKHVWLLESSSFATFAMVAWLLDIFKRIFSDWLIKMLLDSMLWKTKTKTKRKAYQNANFWEGRGQGKKERKEELN